MAELLKKVSGYISTASSRADLLKGESGTGGYPENKNNPHLSHANMFH